MDPRIAEQIFWEDERKRLQEEGYWSRQWKDYNDRQETKEQDAYIDAEKQKAR